MGATAFNEGRSADAKAAFELAGKLDPKNQVAARGLKRAGTLDQVLALLASRSVPRRKAISRQRPNVSERRSARQEATRAAEGLARVQARIAGDAFASAMARGFGELGKRTIRVRAARSKPPARSVANAPEVTAALKQIEQERAHCFDRGEARDCARAGSAGALGRRASRVSCDPRAGFDRRAREGRPRARDATCRAQRATRAAV